jgi:hypothetical protein
MSVTTDPNHVDQDTTTERTDPVAPPATDRARPTTPPQAAGRGGHGGPSFQTVIATGAYAALDRFPPDASGKGQARPRWPEQFGVLVDAYLAEQRGQRDRVRELLASVKIDLPDQDVGIGEALVRFIGRGDDVDRKRFESFFGWLEAEDSRQGRSAFALYQSFTPIFQVIWLVKILCCALQWRRNNFGRYFATNPDAVPSQATLEALSFTMNEGFETDDGDSEVPLGFVFFGQFVDHDLTLDASSHLGELADPEGITNLRSPAFDLDSVYGDGPEGSPELYDQERGFGYLLTSGDGRDLARNRQGRAIIGDPRNDENTLVSQLHLMFLHTHNAVLRMIQATNVDALWGRDPVAEPATELGDFEFARRMVRWHYQWAAVNDWLPRIVDDKVLEAAHAITGVPQGTVSPPAVPVVSPEFSAAQAFFDGFNVVDCCGDPVCRPLMPVEFSAAAFRFAHSQVRSRYDLNNDRLDVPLFAPRPPALAAFDTVDDVDLVDWSRFFEIDPTVVPQPARDIDTWMSAQVFQLPFAPDAPNLAFRNLVRGTLTFDLPTFGQVAAQLGVPAVLGPVASGKLASVGLADKDAPLWFGVLGEAEGLGGRLGPVGGLIVAVSLFRMLDCDEESYVHAPGWQPVLVSAANPADVTVADLVRIGVNERSDEFPA